MSRRILLSLIAFSLGAGVQAALEPQLCERDEILVGEDFSDLPSVPDRWFFRGEWTVKAGTLVRTEIPGENQRVFIKKPRYRDCIIELKFAFQGAEEIRVMTGTPGKYNAVVTLWPHGFRVSTARDQTVPHYPAIHGECALKFERDRFYSLLMEIRGQEILVRVEDDEHMVVGRHPILDRERDYFAFQVDQPGAAFDDVRISSAKGVLEGWTAARKKFERMQMVRPWLPHHAQEQQSIRETIARDMLYRSSAEFREKIVRVEAVKAVAAKQYPEVFLTVKERRKKMDAERKRLTSEDPIYKKLRDAVNKLKRAEVEMLHLLHPKLEGLPEAEYHLALARARAKSKGATAFAMVVANREVMELKMRTRYPELERSNEALLAEGRVARAKMADTPEFKLITKAVADAVRAEKEAVANFAKSLSMNFAKSNSKK